MSGELEDSADLEDVLNSDDADVAASDKEQALSEKARAAIGTDARRLSLIHISEPTRPY